MTPDILIENPSILHIPSKREPLSSDVFLIPKGNITWIFDTGALPENADYIANIPGEKRLVLSHFHRDHTYNLTSPLGITKLYATNYTVKHLHYSELSEKIDLQIIEEETNVTENISLIPLRSSHAKGCLGLLLDRQYFFLGDAIYGQPKDGKSIYNTTILLEEIRQLSEIPADYFCPSHRANPLCRKESLLTFLQSIYEKREKNVPSIVL